MAAMFFSLLFNVPKRSILTAATIAGIGYLIFTLINQEFGVELAGYFVATLVIGIFSEMAARFLKMATTTFVTVAVIPLVPGLGIYRTMQFLVQNDYQAAVQIGVPTLLAAGTIALAIAINTFLIKMFLHFWHR
jgi:uncharacterized membrane protein YjjB (DUF3815 family)